MKDLVSVITPCYNGEGKLNLFLDSILNQTYDNIEFIIINDGSTDNTENIILKYKKIFEKKGVEFIYLKQKNAGQDVALNRGLKYFTGKYLMWTDSDDILDPQNIEEKVKYLEQNRNCGLVYCNTNIVKYGEINKIIKKWDKVLYKNRLENFEDILLGKIIFAGGAWMLRSEYLEKINPKKEIIITGQGQNWQMLLPMAYNYDVGKVDKYLFTYIIYKDSHANKKRTFYEQKKRTIDTLNGLDKILKQINIDGALYNKYYNMVLNQWYINLLNQAINYNEKIESRKIYKWLQSKNIKIEIKLKIKYILLQLGIYKKIYNIIKE